jgi:diadenosine tetraphosphate (Ap4A) HIT family hydrolase
LNPAVSFAAAGRAVVRYRHMAKRNIDNVFEPCDIPAGTHEGCVFCSAQCRLQAVAHLRSVFAVPDAKPVSDAHVLVVPLRHVQDYFDLTARELRDANELLGLLRRRILDADGSVTGFNVGVNCGVSAGQQVMHVHIHLIPRRGDEPVKGVIRNKLAY